MEASSPASFGAAGPPAVLDNLNDMHDMQEMQEMEISGGNGVHGTHDALVRVPCPLRFESPDECKSVWQILWNDPVEYARTFSPTMYYYDGHCLWDFWD